MKLDLINVIIAVAQLAITIFLFALAIYQLNKINSTNDATFIQSITSNFYSAETITLMTLLDADCIEFEANNGYPIFKVNKHRSNKIYPQLSCPKKSYYTSDEIDILLLNNFEDVGLFVEKKLIKFTDARHTFGWYIHVSLNNKAIIAYFKWIEDNLHNPNIFSKVKKLYTRSFNSDPRVFAFIK